jgi:hypothetical protein
MQKWEYCRLSNRYNDEPFVLTFYRPTGVAEVQVKRDKSKGDHDDNDGRARCLAQLGLDGWELVGVLAHAYYPQSPYMWFKRPLT